MNDHNAAVAQNKIRVLHIDDEESFLELFRARIKRSCDDIEIVSISKPEDCLERLSEESFDCIISDYQYPETTGLDLFDEVRDEYLDIPFVILTGQGSEKVASRAMSEGVTDYFLKEEAIKNTDIFLRRIENIVDRYRSEMEKRRILERSSDGYFGLNEDWEFTYVDTIAAEEILRKPKEELLGQSASDLYGSGLEERFKDGLKEVMNERKTVQLEEYYAPHDAWYRVNAYPTQDGISVYIQDITGLRKRQERLDKKIKQQEAIADLSRYALEDPDLDKLMDDAVNRIAEALGNGYGAVLDLQEEDKLLLRKGVGWPKDLIEEPIIDADDAYESQAGYTLSSEEPVVIEDTESEERFSGSCFFDSEGIRSGISVMIGESDDPWGILSTHSTEPREYSSEDVEFVQTVANLLADAVEAKTRKKKIEEGRQKYKTLVENFPHGSVSLYDKDLNYMAIGGKLFDELDSDLDELQNGGVGATLSDEAAEKMRSNYRAVLNGEKQEFNVEIEGKTLRFWSYPLEDEDGNVFAGLSMSRDMSYVREKEEESKIREKALETIKDGIYILDDDRKYIFVNEAFCDLMNLDKDDLLGNKAPVEVDQERFEELEEIHSNLEPGEVGTAERRIERADAEVLEFRFTPFTANGIENGRIGVVRDISAHKKKEKIMEQFGGLVSHDLRNPLNLAKGHVDLAKESGQEDDLEVVQKAHNRMESIIDELMLITMQQDKVEKTDVNVEDAFKEAFYFAGEGNMMYEIENEDLTVKADRSGLISIFENLISNSREHNEGDIRLRVGSLDNGLFYYEDDGEGVDEEDREKIFDYGYTTSSDGRGLGLPIIEHIAEINSWDVELSESESGGFRIEFR